MGVKKHITKKKDGSTREVWRADYYDAAGKRRRKDFKLKKEADDWLADTKQQLRGGTHVASRASDTIAQAGQLWIKAVTALGRERTTIEQYKQHVNMHIVPFLGARKLVDLTIPMVRNFEETLRDNDRSPAMIKKVLVSLGSLLADAQERGSVGHNVVREMRKKRSSSNHRAEKRAKGKLKEGVDYPTPDEIKAVIAALDGRWRPAIILALFSGLRGSELRGLRWTDLDLSARKVNVSQRADRFNAMGRPKSENSERTVPLPPNVVATLKEWKTKCPASDKGLVFPNLSGGILSHQELMRDGWGDAQVKAGLSIDTGELSKRGKPVLAPKYSGLHATRHFYASWCINPKRQGGLELTAKEVQDRLGHASIKLTLDTYSHLWAGDDDHADMAESAAGFF